LISSHSFSFLRRLTWVSPKSKWLWEAFDQSTLGWVTISVKHTTGEWHHRTYFILWLSNYINQRKLARGLIVSCRNHSDNLEQKGGITGERQGFLLVQRQKEWQICSEWLALRPGHCVHGEGSVTKCAGPEQDENVRPLVQYLLRIQADGCRTS
jgi:hypothetical protein